MRSATAISNGTRRGSAQSARIVHGTSGVIGARNFALSQPTTITRQHVFARAHPAFDGHFPGYPIVPGAVLLAEIESLLDAHDYAVVGCDSAKFLAPVAPDVP